MRLSKKQIALGVVLALAAFVVLLNWTWGRLPGEPQMTGRLMRIGDTQVRVLEHPGKDPAIVLIHGLPGTAQDFDKVTAALPGRHTIAFDRPGFGYSTGGYHPFAEQLQTIDQLLDALGVKRPILVGHSYGGTLALAYAERRPQAVRGLVLIDAAAAGQRSTAFESAQSRLVQFLSWPVVQPLADLTFSQLVRTASGKQGDARAFDPGDVDPDHEHRLLALNMQHDDLDAYAGEQLASEDEIAGVDERLTGIRARAVVIQGAEDKLVEPQFGRRLAAILPNARLVMVSGGHMAPYIHPELVAASVRGLLPAAAGDAPTRVRVARQATAK